MRELPIVIAEQGCSSLGNLENAKELIDIAVAAGCQYVKFQKRNPKESLTPEQQNSPHPNPAFAYGDTYLAHREFLEFSVEQHIELANYCKSQGIGYSTSVWDVTSAKEICKLNPDFIKVPSACNTHFEMLKVLKEEYSGDIIISLGMTSKKEEQEILDFFNGHLNRLIIMSCTSGYPVPFEQVCLLEIVRLKDLYGDKVKAIGYSNHALGISLGPVAYSLGATYLEYHYIDDRTKRHTDAAASLEPTGLSKLVRDLKTTNKALKLKEEDILEIESPQRDKLKFKG